MELLRQQLETMKGEFLNVAAHELRSPLGIVRGYVSMLLEGSLPPAKLRQIYELLGVKTDEIARLNPKIEVVKTWKTPESTPAAVSRVREFMKKHRR